MEVLLGRPVAVLPLAVAAVAVCHLFGHDMTSVSVFAAVCTVVMWQVQYRARNVPKNVNTEKFRAMQVG